VDEGLNCHPTGATKTNVKLVLEELKLMSAARPSEIVTVFKVVKEGKLPFAALLLHIFCPLTGGVTTIAPNNSAGATHIMNITKSAIKVIIFRLIFLTKKKYL
jgi:hypothetical protein